MKIDKIWKIELKEWADGDAYVVLIPQDFREHINIEKSETLYYKFKDGKIEITKKPQEGALDRRTIGVGNSVYILLPKALVDIHGWSPGQQFILDGNVEKGVMYLEPTENITVKKMEVVEDDGTSSGTD